MGQPEDTARSEVLFIGGRSGVGKSSVGFEIHEQLSAAGARHCLIEGDNLDLAYPPPWEHGLGARNLAAMCGRTFRSPAPARAIRAPAIRPARPASSPPCRRGAGGDRS